MDRGRTKEELPLMATLNVGGGLRENRAMEAQIMIYYYLFASSIGLLTEGHPFMEGHEGSQTGENNQQCQKQQRL